MIPEFIDKAYHVANTSSKVVVDPSCNANVQHQPNVETSSRKQQNQVPTSDARKEDAHVFLSPKSFILFWWMVAGLRGCELVFLTMYVAFTYWFLILLIEIISETRLIFHFNEVVLAILFLPFALLILVHVLKSLQCVYYCLKARELALANLAPSSRCWTRFCCRPSRQGLDIRVSKRELLEVTCQVYQAYHMSVNIESRALNNVFVLMIVFKCISIPIIHWVVPSSNPPLQRLYRVCGSTCLHLINSVIVPAIILHSNVPGLTLDGGFLKPQFYSDKVAFARAIRDNQQLFVTSYVDFLATLLPHCCQYLCLLILAHLVRRRTGSEPPVKHRTAPTISIVSTKISSKWVLSRVAGNPHQSVWMLVGILVLSIHIAAQSAGKVLGCQLGAHPWLSSRQVCIVLEVNCYRRGIEGNERQIDDLFSGIHTELMYGLTFSHCPRLQIPSSLRNMHQLTNMALFNCTLDQWRADASLQSASHPHMTSFGAYKINMSDIPDGLLDERLPWRMESIELVETNLTTLPASLSTKWRYLPHLTVDFNRFESLPSALVQLKVYDSFSMVGNRLNETEVELLLRNLTSPYTVTLSNSTLTSLPRDNVFNDPQHRYLSALFLEFTQIREVPQYLRDWFQRRPSFYDHSLYGSPYCNVQIPDDDPDQRAYQLQVCARNFGTAMPDHLVRQQQQHPL